MALILMLHLLLVLLDGTHVAATIGGSFFGVAKNATLNCIKVMADDGSGATSDILNGIDFARQQAVNSGRPSVISMSIGGPPNRAIDDAVRVLPVDYDRPAYHTLTCVPQVRNVVNQGIPFIVAAGNDGQSADNVSPARIPETITVGATTINDTFASFSNFGKAVDILAPGADILSAGINADDGVAKLSGTSMAT